MDLRVISVGCIGGLLLLGIDLITKPMVAVRDSGLQLPCNWPICVYSPGMPYTPQNLSGVSTKPGVSSEHH